jgi:hypothetical protein
MTEWRMPMSEQQSTDAFLEWARVVKEATRDLEEKDRELRIRFAVVTEQRAALRARMRAKLGL